MSMDFQIIPVNISKSADGKTADLTITGMKREVLESLIVAIRKESWRLHEKGAELKSKVYPDKEVEAMETDARALRHIQGVGADMRVLSRILDEITYEVYAD